MRKWAVTLALLAVVAFTLAACAPGPTPVSAPKQQLTGFVVANAPHYLDVINPATHRVHRVLYGATGLTFKSAVAPNHTTAYVPLMTGGTSVIDLKNGQTLQVIPTPAGGDVARLAPGAQQLWVAGPNFVNVYDAAAPYKLLAAIKGTGTGTERGLGLVFSKGGHHAFVSGFGPKKTLDVIDTATFKVVKHLSGGGYAAGVIQPDGKLLWAFNIYTGTVHLISTSSLKQVGSIPVPSEACPYWNPLQGPKFHTGYMQGAVGPHGKHIYDGAFDGRILVFSIARHKLARSIWVHDPLPAPSAKNHYGNPHLAQIAGMSWGPRGKHLWVGLADDQSVLELNPATGHVVHVFPGIMSPRFTVVSY